MRALLTKTLFVSLLLSAASSTLQAETKQPGLADSMIDSATSVFYSISSRVDCLRNYAMHCFEKARPYLKEGVQGWSSSNPKTIAWLKSNPKKTFGLVVAATVIAGCTVRITYSTTKKLFTSLCYKVGGGNNE